MEITLYICNRVLVCMEYVGLFHSHPKSHKSQFQTINQDTFMKTCNNLRSFLRLGFLAMTLLFGYAGQGLAQPYKPKVLVIFLNYSDYTFPPDVQSKLIGTGNFSQVDLFSYASGGNGAHPTPLTFAQLRQYDVIPLASEGSSIYYLPSDQALFSPTITQFIDSGGGVVRCGAFNTSITGGTPDFSMPAYQVFTTPLSSSIIGNQPGPPLGAVALPHHPIMTLNGAVRTFSPGGLNQRNTVHCEEPRRGDEAIP